MKSDCVQISPSETTNQTNRSRWCCELQDDVKLYLVPDRESRWWRPGRSAWGWAPTPTPCRSVCYTFSKMSSYCRTFWYNLIDISVTLFGLFLWHFCWRQLQRSLRASLGVVRIFLNFCFCLRILLCFASTMSTTTIDKSCEEEETALDSSEYYSALKTASCKQNQTKIRTQVGELSFGFIFFPERYLKPQLVCVNVCVCVCVWVCVCVCVWAKKITQVGGDSAADGGWNKVSSFAPMLEVVPSN